MRGVKYSLILLVFAIFAGMVQSAPPVTDGLVTHLDAAWTGKTVGTSIETWPDLSAYGNDATQATASSQPVLVGSNANFGGLPTLHFDGGDSMNLPDNLISVDSFTVFVLAKYDSFPSGEAALLKGSPTSGRFKFLYDGYVKHFMVRIADLGYDKIYASIDTNPHVFGADSSINGYLDGVSMTGGPITSSSTVSVGAFSVGSGLTGDVAEVLIYNRQLSSAEYALVNDYLAAKLTSPVATVIYPTDGEVGILQGDVTLQWNGLEDPANAGQLDPNVVKHYVYVDSDRTDDDPNLYYVGETAASGLSASYILTSLSKDQKISWQIEEALDTGSGAAGDPNNLRGPVWTFDMESTIPEIYSITPESQTVLLGANANITVTGANIDYYDWYKDDVELTDTVKYSGLGTDTLVINDVSLTDEGLYTCVVTNDTSDSNDIASSDLYVGRLVSWWKLDGDVSDSVQEVVAGAPTYDGPVVDSGYFVTGTGPDGETTITYAQFDGSTYPGFAIPNTADAFNFYGNGMTVQCWVKTSQSAWQNFVAKRAAGLTDLWQFGMDTNSPLGDINGTRYYASPAVNTGVWRLVTWVYDGSAQRIYVDGEDAGSGGNISGVDASGNTAAISFASWNDTDGTGFVGNMSDVKIWNYPLEEIDVIGEYLGVVGGYICQWTTDMQYDTNDDCVIDLVDFANWAATWLACDRYPESACP